MTPRVENGLTKKARSIMAFFSYWDEATDFHYRAPDDVFLDAVEARAGIDLSTATEEDAYPAVLRVMEWVMEDGILADLIPNLTDDERFVLAAWVVAHVKMRKATPIGYRRWLESIVPSHVLTGTAAP